MVKPLVRVDEGEFREADKEDGSKAFSYYHFNKELSFRLREHRKLASNLSAEALRWDEYEKNRPEDYVPSEDERPQYGLNGNLQIEDRRRLGFISEQGTERFEGPFYLDLHTRTEANDVGSIWFYPQSEHNDRPGVYVSVYLSKARMLWLWEQMRLMPDAQVHIRVNTKLWQHEIDEQLSEPEQMQDFYIERGRGAKAEVTGCTLSVGYPETPPWKNYDQLGWSDYDDEEPAPISKLAKPPLSPEQTAQRLTNGMGWVIGLLVALLLVTLLK